MKKVIILMAAVCMFVASCKCAVEQEQTPVEQTQTPVDSLETAEVVDSLN